MPHPTHEVTISEDTHQRLADVVGNDNVDQVVEDLINETLDSSELALRIADDIKASRAA